MSTPAPKRAEVQFSSALAAALEYAVRGWTVFPLHSIRNGACSCGKADCKRGSAGKHPRIRHGLNAATCDEKTILGWWRKWPDANVGIRTGAGSGLVVLDVDPRHGGHDSLSALMDEYGPLPDTLTAATGSGGSHILFDHPGGTIRNSAGKLGAGLDIRGDGGYIVAAPSNHLNGGYCWSNWGRAIAPAPSWLLEQLEAPSKASKGRQEAAEPWDDAIPEGRRNRTLTSFAGKLRADGADEFRIAQAVAEKNARHCRPPLPEDEVRKIIDSVRRYAPIVHSFKTRWQSAVIADRDFSHGEVRALLGLSLYMDPNGGGCFPRIDVVADRANVSRRKVGEAFEKADHRGYLRRYRIAFERRDGMPSSRYGYVAKIPECDEP